MQPLRSPLRSYFKAILVLIPAFLIAGCLWDDPPTVNDVTPIVKERLRISNAMSGSKPTDFVLSNLKCNRLDAIYACSFDTKGKLVQTHPLTGQVTVTEFARKGLTARFMKAGDVWAEAP